jgi:hypothetical protein
MLSPVLRGSALGLALGLLVAAPGGADDKKEEKKVELKVGDLAPTFQLRDDRDKTWSSGCSSPAAPGIVVASSPSVTHQANIRKLSENIRRLRLEERNRDCHAITPRATSRW